MIFTNISKTKGSGKQAEINIIAYEAIGISNPYFGFSCGHDRIHKFI